MDKNNFYVVTKPHLIDYQNQEYAAHQKKLVEMMKEEKERPSNSKLNHPPEIHKDYKENYGFGKKMKKKEIDRENKILRKKILGISTRKSGSSWKRKMGASGSSQHRVKSLTGGIRRRKQQEIERENRQMAKRVANQQSLLNSEKIARSSEKHYDMLSRMSKARNVRYVQSEKEARRYVKKSHMEGVDFKHISPRMESAALIHKESAKKYKRMKEKMKKFEKHEKIRRDKRKKFFSNQDRSSINKHRVIRRKRTMRMQIKFDGESFKRAGFGQIFKMKMSTNYFEEVDYLVDLKDKFEEILNLGHLDRPDSMKFIFVFMRQRTPEELQEALKKRRLGDSNDRSVKLFEKFEGDREPIIEDEDEDNDSLVENSRAMAREFTLMPKKDDIYWTIFGMKKLEKQIINSWIDITLLDPRIPGKKGKVKFQMKVF